MDNSPPSDAGLTKVEGLWFDSDPLVIKAGTRLFRVSPSQLGYHAKAFGDILSMPLAADAETYEGCPLLTLQDDPQEVEMFLRAIYDPSFEPVSGIPCAEILRFSHKYDAPSLRRGMLKRLALLYPTTLTDFDMLGQQLPAPGNARIVAAVARECQVLWLVPFATLCWMQAPAENYTADIASRAELWAARERYHKLWTRHVISIHDADFEVRTHRAFSSMRQTRECISADRSCATSLMRKYSRDMSTRSYDMLAILEDEPLRGTDSRKLCRNCTRVFLDRFDDVRQQFWDALPGLYAVEGWDELEKMKNKDLGKVDAEPARRVYLPREKPFLALAFLVAHS
ncbi:hypothetical protein BD626DRAFT_560517 [Schizophyllum amplum]|uniref:BTB domain-containing protein n=1 Tax=Schizophyllum amplum TaxID=97359 RepID=A0A550BX30_9AGAR|nr:hypothetical protein BD626DRAFT_560517 [Auriculariopsis ampla]